jgi:hypothetical protein
MGMNGVDEINCGNIRMGKYVESRTEQQYIEVFDRIIR